MKKKIRDVTCEEYLSWANDRAADGHWSLEMALNAIQDTKKIYNTCPLFREKIWEEIKNDHYQLDAEIEINDEKRKNALRSWVHWLRRILRHKVNNRRLL